MSKRPRMDHATVTGLADLVSDTVTQVRVVVTLITQSERVHRRDSDSVPNVSNNCYLSCRVQWLRGRASDS